MTARVRIVGWNVQPVVMVDDGDNLTPVNVNGTMIPAADWEQFKAGGDEQALATVCEQVAQMQPPEPNRATRRAAAKNGKAKVD